MTDHPQASGARSRLVTAVLPAVAIVLVAIAGAIYGLHAFGRNPDQGGCVPALARAKKIAPLARGEVAAVVAAQEPRSLATLAFTDATGARRTLADWRGRSVLLNIWATWCVPCRKEMPALDALQRELGGADFEVVAVNADTRNPDRPRVWLKENGISNLAYYADPSGQVMRDLKVFGLPTSILLDGSGCAVASIAGPAEWASPDALALVKAALAK